MTRYLKPLLVFALGALAAGCAADRLHHDGLKDADRGNYEQGIAKLEQAVSKDPDNLIFRLDLRSRKESAVQQLISAAEQARSAGHLDAADAAFRRVLVLEPVNDRALKGAAGIAADRRHIERVAKASQLLEAKQVDAAEAEVRAVLTEDPGFAPATTLVAKINQAKGPTTVVPHLHSRNNRPVSLQFRDAPTKMVFEVLARQTGLNFIFDKDVKTESKTTIFVSEVPVEQVIDLILEQNQLGRQVLSDTMVLIYPNTPAKQKDYQDEIVHTFYLANAAPKDAESMLKTVLGAKTMYVDERSSTIVLRDTPEHVRMAEKLIAALDVPEAEVIMEVEVLEVTKTTLDQIGINYPTSISSSLTSPSGAKGLVLGDLHKQTSDTITVSPLSVSIDLLKTTGQTNVLSSPRIRAKNKEKAKILIGNRVPVVTSGTSATTGGSYSTSNVQYLDIGLTLEVTPTVHLDGNVVIKTALEVSSIVKEFDVQTGPGSSTHVYQIGTRNATTTLELRDGETQVLAGLIQDNDRKSSSHIPGLGDLPLLGRLFGTAGTTQEKNEIVLSITPRIIRAQSRPAAETTEFWYGSETQTRSAPFAATAANAANAGTGTGPVTAGSVSYGAGNGGAAIAVPSPSSAPRALPTRIDAGTAAPTAPAVDPATGAPTADNRASGAAAIAAGAGVAVVAGGEAASAKAAAPADARPKVTVEGPDTAKVGDEVSVAVKLAGGDAFGRIRVQVGFDPTALQLVSAEPGDLAPPGDAPKVDVRAGGVQLELGGNGGPLAGGGSLVNLRLRAVAPRPAVAIATQVVLVGEDGVAVAATQATPLRIAITP